MGKGPKIVIIIVLLVAAGVIFYKRAKPYIFPPQLPPGAGQGLPMMGGPGGMPGGPGMPPGGMPPPEGEQ
jgi:4-hydroxybenzoate polyprenyltransferase